MPVQAVRRRDVPPFDQNDAEVGEMIVEVSWAAPFRFVACNWDHEPGLHKSLNDECRMTNDERNPKTECRNALSCAVADFVIRIWSFLPTSSFVIRHSGLRISAHSLFRIHRDHDTRRWVRRRDSVLDCGSPLPLLHPSPDRKAPEDWRSPKPGRTLV